MPFQSLNLSLIPKLAPAGQYVLFMLSCVNSLHAIMTRIITKDKVP